MPEIISKNSFNKYSNKITENFLQSAMIVDDQAYFMEVELHQEKSKGVSKSLRKPGLILGGPQKADLRVAISKTEDTENLTSEEVKHQLNAKVLIDTFADSGIGCTIIRPKDSKEPDLKKRVLNLAQNTDIIVFDWILTGDETQGGKISEFIVEITKESITKDKRLRLIAVYTGNKELPDVIDSIKSALQENNLSFENNDEEFTITVDSVRISVFAKKYAKIPKSSYLYKRQVTEEKCLRY